jgi:hypothetical protein
MAQQTKEQIAGKARAKCKEAREQKEKQEQLDREDK